MTISEKAVKVFEIEPEYQKIEKGYNLALESNDIDLLKAVLKEMHIHFGFATIRSYVGKFMEEERFETIKKPELFEKYCKHYTEHCNEAFKIYMKDDEEYMEHVRKMESKGK